MWPVDPDLAPEEEPGFGSTHAVTDPFAARPPRTRWPVLHWRILVAIAIGGCVGGLARYWIGLAWVSPADTFPMATFFINTSGAFVLALLLVVVLEVLPPTTYLRPVVGTGFCGAYTTFSSVSVEVDQQVEHGFSAGAVGYVAASLAAGLAAASFGIVLGRAIAANRGNAREG
jgi:CrcB protein